MHRTHLLPIVSLIACLHGLVAMVGAVVWEDVTPLLKTTSLVSGALLVVAAWLLVQKRKSAVLLMWLSAAIYVLSIVYPGVVRQGVGVFGVLMGSFYWSVGIRVVLAVLAQLALRFHSPR
jgi:hypothetical protein